MLSAEGAAQDPDCILSVRAGSSRRQGALKLNKTFQFPVTGRDAVPFKVDLLRHVGSAQAKLTAEDGTYAMSIDPPVDKGAHSSIRLDLQVTNRPLMCGRKREELRTSSRREGHISGVKPRLSAELDVQSSEAVQARCYFEDHNIMRVVQSMLEAILRDQPSDPREYIATFMDRISATNKQSKRCPDSDHIAANAVAAGSAMAAEVAGVAAADASEGIGSECNKLPETLATSKEDNSLEPSMDTTGPIVEAVPEVGQGQSPTLLLVESADRSLTDSAQAQQDLRKMGYLLSQLREELACAALDGRLEDEIRCVVESRPAQPPAEVLIDWRRRALHALVTATADGSLDNELDKIMIGRRQLEEARAKDNATEEIQKPLVPVPPSSARPPGKRPGSGLTVQQQQDVNARLEAENASLKTEL